MEECYWTIAGISSSIQSSLSSAYKEQVVRNRSIFLSNIDVIIVLGRRNIPFCGHKWDKITKREDGNFDYWKSEFDPTLRDHLADAPKNVKYISPMIQNEFIKLIGLEVCDSILKDVGQQSGIQ